MPHQDKWAIDRIEKWFPELSQQNKERRDSYGFLRLIKILSPGTQIKASLDFMEGEVRGRRNDSVIIDADFVANGADAVIAVGGKDLKVRVPSYEDYFLLKLMSARPSDIRDIVALVAAKGIPDEARLRKRIAAVVNKPELLIENTDLVLKDLSDERFVDSWRGTFVTEQFTEADRSQSIRDMEYLKKILGRKRAGR